MRVSNRESEREREREREKYKNKVKYLMLFLLLSNIFKMFFVQQYKCTVSVVVTKSKKDESTIRVLN